MWKSGNAFFPHAHAVMRMRACACTGSGVQTCNGAFQLETYSAHAQRMMQSTLMTHDNVDKYGMCTFTSMSSRHQQCAEGPRLHHGEVEENAVHSVKREAVCASGDVCISAWGEKQVRQNSAPR